MENTIEIANSVERFLRPARHCYSRLGTRAVNRSAVVPCREWKEGQQVDIGHGISRARDQVD